MLLTTWVTNNSPLQYVWKEHSLKMIQNKQEIGYIVFLACHVGSIVNGNMIERSMRKNKNVYIRRMKMLLRRDRKARQDSIIVLLRGWK